MKIAFKSSTRLSVGPLYCSLNLPLKRGERKFRVTRDHTRFHNTFEIFVLGFSCYIMWSTHAQRARYKGWLNSFDELV